MGTEIINLVTPEDRVLSKLGEACMRNNMERFYQHMEDLDGNTNVDEIECVLEDLIDQAKNLLSAMQRREFE